MAYTTINKPSDYFNTKLISGNGGTQSITGVGHQPDFTWIKSRSRVDPHSLTDSVRGVASQLDSSLASVPTTHSDAITSFDSDGFSLGSQADVNRSGTTFVSWNWKANGAGSANTDGSINTIATSANTTAGFSISKYTGTGSAGTIGHGLGAEPEVIIVKKLNSSESWFSYHKPLGNTGRLVLNATDGVATDAGYWNSTTPTNQVFYVTSNGGNNASGDTYMAYCFAPKTGYSKFGSFVGNGNDDGTFVYTGFKPSFILLKNTSATSSWLINDNKRPGYNANSQTLVPNNTDAENTGTDRTDFLSNGFKLRVGASTAWNGSGNNIIYMAFAEAPLVGTNNVPCTAR